MPILTKKQHSVLTFINTTCKRRGYSPNHREIAEEFHMRSPSQVQRMLNELEVKGFIRRYRHKAYGIVVSRLPPDDPAVLSSAGERAAYARGFKEGRRAAFAELRLTPEEMEVVHRWRALDTRVVLMDS